MDSLQQENIRLKALLEASQREVYGFIEERAGYFGDPVVGEILRLRREVKGRAAHEADLLLALEEYKEKLTNIREIAGEELD